MAYAFEYKVADKNVTIDVICKDQLICELLDINIKTGNIKFDANITKRISYGQTTEDENEEYANTSEDSSDDESYVGSEEYTSERIIPERESNYYAGTCCNSVDIRGSTKKDGTFCTYNVGHPYGVGNGLVCTCPHYKFRLSAKYPNGMRADEHNKFESDVCPHIIPAYEYFCKIDPVE
jgi:hypothetical protein